MSKSALVMFSGGQDSTTCLAVALSRHEHVEAVVFDYAQRHRIELSQAQKLADLAGIQLTLVDLTVLSQLTPNALTRSDIPITTDASGLPSTFVPGRNLVFLSFAGIVARQKGIYTIYGGMCDTDFSGYPDCRDAFVKSMNQTLNLAMDEEFEIVTPLMNLTKAQTVQLMSELGRIEWYADTHTCYEGRRPACGVCPACELRIKGFREAGIRDPLGYEIEVGWG